MSTSGRCPLLPANQPTTVSFSSPPLSCHSDSLLQKAYSAAKIERPKVIDEATYKLKVGGLNNPRMGTTDLFSKCSTCREGMTECPGYFGRVELARSDFHPGAYEFIY